MTKRILSPLLAALFFASLFGSLAGCNTVEGAGKDIEQGGSKPQGGCRWQQQQSLP